MKRTLIVATTSYAGMGPYVSEIVNTFSPKDDIYYFFHDYEDDFFKKNIKKELHSKSVFHKESNTAVNKLYNLLTNSNRYDKKVLRLCKENNIELVHYINNCPSIWMQRKFEHMGITLLSTVHDLIPHEAKKVWYKQIRHNIIYKRLDENIKHAKYLLTNSMAQYSELKAMFPSAQIVFHAFPTLVTNEIKTGKDIPQEMQNVSKPYILFFGRIEEYKGISILYDAFCNNKALCDNFNLVIAGSGQLNIEHQKDKKNVLFINRYIKDSEIAYLYMNARCVVYPYISATQSGVLSLAFYYGVPTVTSDVPFFKSIIEDTGTGVLFETNNVDDLKDKLLNILQTDCSEMRKCQREYYENNYNCSSIRNNLLKIYSMEWTEDCIRKAKEGG